MTTLTIDIGNTNTKIGLWSNQSCLYRKSTPFISIEYIREIIKENDVEGVIFSSVGKNIEGFVNELKKTGACDIEVNFNQREIEKIYGDKINYKGSIGVDRIAAYLGAETLFPETAKLIIDSGTAITLDVVDSKGKFCGGNISLGLMSRKKALSIFTSKLPFVEDMNLQTYFGNDTISAIEAGALNGVTGEVIYTMKLAEEKFGVKQIVITGGDSCKIIPGLKKYFLNIFHDEDLVGRGLNYHLRKNYILASQPEKHYM